LNRSTLPSMVLILYGIDGKMTTPFEALTKTKPRALPLHTFGCLAVAKIFKPGDKLDARGEECIFIGINEDQNSYKLLSLENQWKLINCFSVSFHEHGLDNWKRLFEYAKAEPNAMVPRAPTKATTVPETKSADHEAQPFATPEYPQARTSQRIRRPYNEWRNDTVP
jgi:hypothetical protein